MSSNNKPNEMIAGYVPVVHEGYIRLFDQYPDARIGVFDADIISGFDYLRKDIRALSPENAVRAITGLGRQAAQISMSGLIEESFRQTSLIMPDDDISRSLIASNESISLAAKLEPVFLRWDRDNVQVNAEVQPDRTLTTEQINPEILASLQSEGSKSTNWWRHIGAVIANENEILNQAHNQTLPTDYGLYIDGDPRITAKRGSNIETSIDVHAESKAIAELARHGVALEGTELYATTFPCPNCAKLIAVSGIKTVYFVEGYAMLDGYSVLKDAGIEIVKIETELDLNGSSLNLPYPTN